METTWKLIETCIQPIITYASETWNLNKKEEKDLDRIQENIIKRVLMTPTSTPAEALYIESGLLDISTIIKKNRINMEKRLQKKPAYLTTKIMNTEVKGGWKEKTKRIKTEINQITNQNPTADINKETILNYFSHKITNQASEKSKVQHILNNKTWKPGKRPNYMNKLTRNEVSTIFKARTRMLDIKNNFRNKYRTLKCRKCEEETETQEHIMNECTGIHKDNTTKVKTEDLFNDDLINIKNQAAKIQEIMKKLDLKETNMQCSSPTIGLSELENQLRTS